MRVRHTTGYRYDTEVGRSYNEARLTPMTGLEQTVLEALVQTTPDCRQQRYWDYWGTQVTAFDVHTPHTALEVAATSVVDTTTQDDPTETPGWELLRSEGVRDRFVELLTPTSRTLPGAALTALGAETAAGLAPFGAARALADLVRDRVAYRRAPRVSRRRRPRLGSSARASARTSCT